MTSIRGTTTLVGLLGWPTAHSLSPRMQNAAFDALGLDWAYVPLPTPPEHLEDAVRGLVATGFAGANVTIPHKERIVLLCDDLDEVAAGAGSVNTLVVEDGRVLGSSTDGAAVTSQVDATDRTVLVLGAGRRREGGRACARGRRRGPRRWLVSRRDAEWPPSGEGVDVLVNCTPVKDAVLVQPYPGMQVVDLAYDADGSETALVAAARRAGCETVVDGLDVLLAQGAASFERWTGEPAPFAAMAKAVRPR